jgi:hypothetical protein
MRWYFGDEPMVVSDAYTFSRHNHCYFAKSGEDGVYFEHPRFPGTTFSIAISSHDQPGMVDVVEAPSQPSDNALII